MAAATECIAASSSVAVLAAVLTAMHNILLLLRRTKAKLETNTGLYKSASRCRCALRAHRGSAGVGNCHLFSHNRNSNTRSFIAHANFSTPPDDCRPVERTLCLELAGSGYSAASGNSTASRELSVTAAV